MRVREPAAYRQRVLRVEDVRCRGIVDDNGVLEISSNHGKILDIVPLVVVAGFAEETVMNHLVNVELVQERIAILLTTLDTDGRKRKEQGRTGSSYL